jgi:predicted Zn-ribbon and HTH transcriptional regulator
MILTWDIEQEPRNRGFFSFVVVMQMRTARKARSAHVAVGAELIEKLAEIERREERAMHRQPEKCRGCVWGTWNGTVQYCSRPVCVRG